MQMVGQDHDRVDFERVVLPHTGERLVQAPDSTGGCQPGLAIAGDKGKEIRAAGPVEPWYCINSLLSADCVGHRAAQRFPAYSLAVGG
jgi:hypothetical protein